MPPCSSPAPMWPRTTSTTTPWSCRRQGPLWSSKKKDLTGEKLVQTVSEMLTQPGKLAEMGRNARSLSVDDSLDRIATALLELVKKA